MAFITYLGFTVFLYLWEMRAIQIQHPWLYFCVLMITGIAAAAAAWIWRSNRWNRVVIFTTLTFVNIGAAVAGTGYVDQAHDAFLNYYRDFIAMLIAFVLTYMFIRFSDIYTHAIMIRVLMLVVLIVVFGALCFSKANGAHISFFGILIFGPALCGYPFIVSYFLSKPETRFIFGDVRYLSWNLICLLGYTFLLYFGCFLCNEFGLLLILGIVSTTLFYMKCKERMSKLIYTGSCFLGVIVVLAVAGHIQSRLKILLHLTEIIEDESLAGKAEWILYMIRFFRRIGFWGRGIGTIPKTSVYHTFATDHVLVTIFNDYSIFIVIGMLILVLVMSRNMIEGCMNFDDFDDFDKYLSICISIIFMSMFALHIASNLGSFLTAGIGFPWVSDGSSVNLMCSVLIASYCAVTDKRERGQRT